MPQPLYRLKIAYRGTAYAGWQRQINALAVQQVVEEALAKIFRESVRLHAASRTDTGVHARGQVAHFSPSVDRPLVALVKGVNTLLPEDIRVMEAGKMREGFHARFRAGAKEYRYSLSSAPVLSPLRSLFVAPVMDFVDVELMREASKCLVGLHDFRAFALAGGSQKTSERRILEVSWLENGSELEFRILGEGFLRGMVRSIVGTLREVGERKRSVDSFAALLRGADRQQAGPTAPARALILHHIHYDEEWQPTEVFPQ